MREILFRGKARSAFGDRWIYGDYVYYAGGHQIWAQEENDRGNYLVDPSTLGQFTGLIDKHGVKIFEGDILKGLRYHDFGQGGEYVPCQYVVTWDAKWVRFSPLHLFSGYVYDLKNFEVIGNIHDNPELLEGGLT